MRIPRRESPPDSGIRPEKRVQRATAQGVEQALRDCDTTLNIIAPAMITTHITVAKSSMSLTQCSFDTLYTLYLAQFVHHGVETFGVLHVEADVAFENAVVAVDVHFADIDTTSPCAATI